MTGYELSRNWFDWSFENPDLNTPTHTALYMWFIEKWNRCGQKEKMSITTSECSEAIGIKSRNTYTKVFNDLVEWGFITVIVSSKNQFSCNVISFSLAQNMCKQDASNRTALDQALIQHVSEQEDSTQAGLDTINKQVNKETNKQINNINLLSENDEFENFVWNVYEKKGNKKASLNIWSKLNKKQKSEVLEKIYPYVLSTPDKQYRKNLETYLNPKKEHWNDEIIKRTNTIASRSITTVGMQPRTGEGFGNPREILDKQRSGRIISNPTGS